MTVTPASRVPFVQVSCPAFPSGRAYQSDIPARVAALNGDWTRTGSPTLSLEHILAAQLEPSVPVSQARATIPFDRFQIRPASEPVLYAVWAGLRRDLLTEGLADALVEGLVGTACGRWGHAMSAPDFSGRRTRYASSDVASGWLDRVNAVESTRSDPFLVACHAYAEVALSHPYADGNGRLARALFQRAFARAGLLDAPLIPLGPLIYLNHKIVIAALVHLGTTGDWPPFLDVMARLTHKALAFTEHQIEAFARSSPRDNQSP